MFTGGQGYKDFLSDCIFDLINRKLLDNEFVVRPSACRHAEVLPEICERPDCPLATVVHHLYNLLIRTYMHGKLHETKQCLKIDYLIIHTL